MSEHGAVVERLIAAGADVQAANLGGFTPLHTACENDSLPAVEALLAAPGTDLNAASGDGSTPLHLAKSKAVALALVRAGAAAGLRDAQGRSAAAAASRGNAALEAELRSEAAAHRCCAACRGGGGGEGSLLLCGGCRAVRYCDAACQRQGWLQHKRSCRLTKAGKR